MAKYKSGEEAEVGDIVKCVVPKSPIDDCCDLDGDCTYKVVRTSQSHIHVADKVLYSYRFELISRAPSPEPEQPAMKPEQSPPLVVWPEPEKQLCSGHLCVGDFFTVEHDGQLVWRVVQGGYIPWFGPFSSTAYDVLPHNNTPVRRLMMKVRPQFTVI